MLAQTLQGLINALSQPFQSCRSRRSSNSAALQHTASQHTVQHSQRLLKFFDLAIETLLLSSPLPFCYIQKNQQNTMAQSLLSKAGSIAGWVAKGGHNPQSSSNTAFFALSPSRNLALQHGQHFLGNMAGLATEALTIERAEKHRAKSVCRAEGGFLGRLGRVIKEKAKSDIDRLFSGTEKTRKNLQVVDELLTYWNIQESESILDELEEVRGWCRSFTCRFSCLLGKFFGRLKAARKPCLGTNHPLSGAAGFSVPPPCLGVVSKHQQMPFFRNVQVWWYLNYDWNKQMKRKASLC